MGVVGVDDPVDPPFSRCDTGILPPGAYPIGHTQVKRDRILKKR